MRSAVVHVGGIIIVYIASSSSFEAGSLLSGVHSTGHTRFMQPVRESFDGAVVIGRLYQAQRL